MQDTRFLGKPNPKIYDQLKIVMSTLHYLGRNRRETVRIPAQVGSRKGSDHGRGRAPGIKVGRLQRQDVLPDR